MASSSMVKLSETLLQKLASDQEAVQSQTSKLLEQHKDFLQRLSSDALSTTEAAIRSEHQRLEEFSRQACAVTKKEILALHEQLRASEAAFLKERTSEAKQRSSQVKALNKELADVSQATLKRVMWMLAWPLFGALVISLVIVGGTMLWSWATISQANEVHQKMLTDRQAQLDQMSKNFFSSPPVKKISR